MNSKYIMKSFKHYELELLKLGKVSKHSTKTRGKTYDKGKIYLSNNIFTNKDYELYDLGDLSIEEVFSTINGKGCLYSSQSISERRELLGWEETLVVRVARRALTCFYGVLYPILIINLLISVSDILLSSNSISA